MLPCGWVVYVLCPLFYHVHMFLIKIKQTKPSCVLGKTGVAIAPIYDKKNKSQKSEETFKIMQLRSRLNLWKL